MIDALPALLPAIVSAPSDASPGANGGGPGAAAGDFAQTLGAFLDARDASAPPSAPSPAPTGRQALADDGKDMPDAPTDDTARSTDAAAAWIAALGLPVPQLPPGPAASTAPVPDPSTGAPLIPGGTDVFPAPATPTPTPTPTPTTATGKAQPPKPPSDTPPPLDTARAIAGARLDQRTPRPLTTSLATAAIPDAVPGTGIAGTIASAEQRDPALPASTPAAPGAPALAPNDAFQVSTVPHPAREIFAAAIASAARWPDSARVERDGSGIAPALTLDPLPRPAVAATGAPHDAPLDLAKEQGLQGLIERIETLRDEADARDTRIRLVPDALGAVDIAVRTQGEAVHVHFTAERPETQTLLADAQPRLSELAQQRGVRIAETSVSTGNPNANGGGATPQPRPNRAPRAPAAADAADDPATHQRLA